MKLSIDHNSHLPLHTQVEHVPSKLINKSEYKTGKPLSKEIELTNRFGVSRNTVRQEPLLQLYLKDPLLNGKAINSTMQGNLT